jgi:hypothetical protein
MKRRNQVQIVPVWMRRVDRRLYVLALLAYAEQLSREESANESKAPARNNGGEDHHD